MFDELVIGQLTSVRDLWRWGTSAMSGADLYYGHGTDNPTDEMDRLVCHCLQFSPGLPLEFLDAKLLVSEKEHIFRLVEERIKTRKPLPYLLKECWFAGLKFRIDERALIPRSPIAELIEGGFSPWLNVDSVSTVLDLCTGNGCIAIATALAFPDVQVDGADNSAAALALAAENLKDYGLQGRVNLIQSDLFSELEGKRYDLIITNPPYVPEDEAAALPLEFGHEPLDALRSGADGLVLMEKILYQAEGFLNPGGLLVGEVGLQWPLLEKKFPRLPFTWVEFERGGVGVFILKREDLVSLEAQDVG